MDKLIDILAQRQHGREHEIKELILERILFRCHDCGLLTRVTERHLVVECNSCSYEFICRRCSAVPSQCVSCDVPFCRQCHDRWGTKCRLCNHWK